MFRILNKFLGRFNTIQTKIAMGIAIAVSAMAIIVGIFGILVTRFGTEEALKGSLLESAELAAFSIESSLDVHRASIEYIATDEILVDESVTWEEKHAFLTKCAKDMGYLDAYIFDTAGVDHISGYNVATMDYFKYPMMGKTYVSVPYPKSHGAGMYMVVSAPVYNGDEIVAVICLSIDQITLQATVGELIIGAENASKGYVLDKAGTIIGSRDYNYVLEQYNRFEDEAADASFLEVETLMLAGESGIGEVYVEGARHIIAYAPVGNSDGWSVAVTTAVEPFMKAANLAIVFLVFIIVAVLIGCSFFAIYIGKSIATPVTLCSDRLKLLAAGDLKTPVPEVSGKDEVAQLAVALTDLVEGFSRIVLEVDTTLSNIANGDFSQDIASAGYPGDFASLKENLISIDQRLNQTIGGIRIAADSVYGGAQQVSGGAQSLAQGATEQASSIEQLSATIMDISDRVKRTAENAVEANNTSDAAGKSLIDCNRQMENLVVAMGDISKKSDEIGKIIKVIEDISFQTNILALNAAVEAARAGSAGKGFSVVADEVRSLAGKSAEASKNTSDLIRSSVESVQVGMQLLTQTVEALHEVVAAAQRSSVLVGAISEDAREQAISIGHVTSAVEQISGVVHMTSATSEESAATSASLTEQAEVLKQAVSQFKFKTDALC